MAAAANKEPLDPRVDPETTVVTELLEKTEIEVCPAGMPNQGRRFAPFPRHANARELQAPPDPRDHEDPPVPPVAMEILVVTVAGALPVVPVPKDPPVDPAATADPDPEGIPDPRARLEPVPLVNQDAPDHQDAPAGPDVPDGMALPVPPVLPVMLVPTGDLAVLETTADRAAEETPVSPDPLEPVITAHQPGWLLAINLAKLESCLFVCMHLYIVTHS